MYDSSMGFSSSLFVLLFILLYHNSLLSVKAEGKVQHIDCKKISSCTCTSDSGTIDLSPLDSKDGTPKFKATATGGDVYFFNPCSPFTEKDCKNAATCQQDGSNYFVTGTQNSADFIQDAVMGLQIGFTSGPKKSYVQLLCDESSTANTFAATGETGNKTQIYNMTLTSKYACPIKKGGGGGGLSAGSILCILLVVFIVLYLVIGVLLNKYVRGAQGMELIPNISFWKDFPLLVQDGFTFCINGCKTNTSGYDEI